MNHSHTPLIIACACSLVVANLAFWRATPGPGPQVIYVTNTVREIREVPAPSVGTFQGIVTNWGPFVTGPFVATNGIIVVPDGGSR